MDLVHVASSALLRAVHVGSHAGTGLAHSGAGNPKDAGESSSARSSSPASCSRSHAARAVPRADSVVEPPSGTDTLRPVILLQYLMRDAGESAADILRLHQRNVLCLLIRHPDSPFPTTKNASPQTAHGLREASKFRRVDAIRETSPCPDAPAHSPPHPLPASQDRLKRARLQSGGV